MAVFADAGHTSKSSLRHLGALWLALVLITTLPALANTPLTQTQISEIERLIEKTLHPKDARDYAAPAVSISVGKNGTLAFAAGYGEARSGVPATKDTVYRIGSITKQFTAAAVLSLIERGATVGPGGPNLSLDLPLAETFRASDSWNASDRPPITVKSLLAMTSNLPNFTRRPPHTLDPWGAVASDNLLGALTRLRRIGEPGSFEYSNTSYFLLAELIDDLYVEGQSATYHNQLRDVIFTRAELSNTGFSSDEKFKSTIAHPTYRRRPAFTQPDWLKGSGDMASTVVDLFKWNDALMSDRVLTSRTRADMFADNARVDVWNYYGMGWFISHRDNLELYRHSGTVPGYTSFNAIARRGEGPWVSVSILTNSDGIESLDDLAQQVVDIALQ